jgi:Flp pilus assembly protein TadD
LRTGGWKYIHSPDPELYHVALDPDELRDLIDTEPARAAAMKEQLRSIIEDAPDPPASRATRESPDSEEIARLQALGYLSTGSGISGKGTEIDDFEPQGPNPRDRLDVIQATVAAAGLFTGGELAKSETAFRWVLDREPGNVHATRGLLYALLAQQQPEKAVRSLRKLAETRPDSAGLRAVAGTFATLLVRENEFAEAVPQFRIALEEKPNDVRLLEGLAIALERLSRDDEACGVYERIARLEPGRLGIYSRWSVLLHRLGRPAEAIEILRRGRSVLPEDPYLANNLAFRLATSPERDLRDGEEAVRLAELANELSNGKHVNFLNTLAAAYACAGRFQDAIATSRQALELARESNDEANIDRALDSIERFERGESIEDVGSE